MIIDINRLIDNEAEEIIISDEVDGFKIYEDVKVLTPIKLFLKAFFRHDILTLEMNVSYKFEVMCSRCLKEFIKDKNIKFKEDYSLEQIKQTFEDNIINSEHIAKELIILKTPIKSLCREDCKGICAVCGKDKNEFDCDCENETSNPYFDKLKILLSDKDKEV